MKNALEFAEKIQAEYDKILETVVKKAPSLQQSSIVPVVSVAPSVGSIQKSPHSVLAKNENPSSMPNLSILCRVYIGSIHFELSEEDIRRAFSPFGVIKSISMTLDSITGHHKGYCFLEYDTPDAASLALESMHGVELCGRQIRVGRSNNFPSELPPGLPRPLGQRLYIANIHEAITEEDLLEIFSSFGSVRHCILIHDPILKRHKHYGYVEFEEESVAQAALLTMKNFHLGGQVIFIGKTILGGDLPISIRSGTGCVLSLENVLTLKELQDEDEDDLITDIREECEKLGAVASIVITRPEIPSGMIGFLVTFADSSVGDMAVQLFDGRYFSSHRIRASIYNK